MLIAPGGKRFTFWHRWATGVGAAPSTRVFTADEHGKDLRLIADSGHSSHNNWRDAETLMQWTSHSSHGQNFYLINERTLKYEALDPDLMNVNGHPSYLPGGRWIVCDTPPDKEARKQHIFLYDTKARRKVELGAFHAPPEYTGIVRCDTTPRFSPDGKKIVIDSPHDGKGRQMYLIDISKIVG